MNGIRSLSGIVLGVVLAITSLVMFLAGCNEKKAERDLYVVVGVQNSDVLNLRSGPGVNHAVVAVIPPDGVGIRLTGREQQVDESTWAEVDYNGQTGWVNRVYLAVQVGTPPDGISTIAAQAIMAIKMKDFTTLGELVSPDTGLRFSPYAYVQASDVVFNRDEVKALFTDPTVYRFGFQDGSGLPIDLTFQDYYLDFVYDVDFAQPGQVGFDTILSGGSRINNIADFYPGSKVVEYYFSGFDPQYQGMDWRSLRLVFQTLNDRYYLVGIVHDEWGP